MDPAMERWIEGRFGSATSEVLFTISHLSAVVGVRLEDGREIVVKARGGFDRVRECVAAQAVLHDDGFPCPKPLTDVCEVDGYAVHAEEHVPGGMELTGTEDAVVDAYAALLADLLRRSRRLALSTPRPPPMWLHWDHASTGVWPDLEESPPFLEREPTTGWLVELAARARERLRSARLEEIVGHGDWEAQNMRWASRRRVHVVHDWDSLAARPEAALVGTAAATFPSGRLQPELAPLRASARFLDTYQEVAGRAFTVEEREVAWASGLWLAAHNARMELLYGNVRAVLDALELQGEQRLSLAGAS